MGCSWDRVSFGETGMTVTPLGLGSSYGLEARDVTRAVERGINYIYWGGVRRPSYAEAIRALGPSRRDELLLVVQSYARLPGLMRPDLEKSLRALGTCRADLLLLGWWNEPPPRAIVDAALSLKASGKARGVMISCHYRESFAAYIDDPSYDGIMVRYSAAHPGAEREVFPLLSRRRPGVVSYTATRWGTLLRSELMPAGERTPTASDCYRFSLSNPDVDVCLTGPANARQLDEALSALDKGPLGEEEMAWMRRVGAHVREVTKATGFGRGLKVADRIVDAASRLSHVLDWGRGSRP
jgi:aryl-alcohol dehydrogenase-like predicted oxidoreductase